MFRLTLAVVISLFVGRSLPAAEKDRNAGGEEAKLLEGTWRLVKGEVAGKKLPDDPKKPIKLEISGDHYVVTAESVDEGTVRVIPDKSPKAMNIIGTKGPNEGKTFLAIYELKGDQLKVCYDLAGKTRPTEFKTKAGSSHFLGIYEREKR